MSQLLVVPSSNDKNPENDSWNEESSVDTNDAFLEFIGLSLNNLDFATTLDLDEEPPPPTNNNSRTTINGTPSNSRNDETDHIQMTCKTIQLPPKCSRHHIPPSSCLALVLDNVLTENQCQYLIQKATTAGSGFRYITEATHRAPDGSSYTVQIQNPNPHKLSVIDTLFYDDVSTCSFGHDDNNHDDLTDDDGDCDSTALVDAATIIMKELYFKINEVLESHPSYRSFQKRTHAGNMQGLNPRMRILKYDSLDDDRFEAHFDATTFVPCPSHKTKNSSCHDECDRTKDQDSNQSSQMQSLITVLLYLNDGDGIDFDGGETLYLNYDHGTAVQRQNVRKQIPWNEQEENANIVKVVPKTGRVVLFEHDLFHSGAPLSRGTKYIMRTDILFHDQQQQRQWQQENMEQLAKEKEEEQSQLGRDASAQVGDEVSSLVSDVCREINLPSGDCSILRDMDLLAMTCEAFLAPGHAMVQSMLLDGGMKESSILLLLKETASLLRKERKMHSPRI